MKLVNLDQQIFVPVVDETKGGVAYEMQMTVEQFFRRFFSEVPPIIDAIPVEWVNNKINNGNADIHRCAARVLFEWQKEQEVQDG